MEIWLLLNHSELNKLEKSTNLVAKLQGTLREATDIISPVITIENDSFPEFNYAYIPDFHRYYFVTDIASVRKNIWAISLRVDVLNSYKTKIKANTAFIARNENKTNPYIIDNRMTIQQTPDIHTLSYDTPFTNSSNIGKRYVLEVITSKYNAAPTGSFTLYGNYTDGQTVESADVATGWSEAYFPSSGGRMLQVYVDQSTGTVTYLQLTYVPSTGHLTCIVTGGDYTTNENVEYFYWSLR